MENNKIAIYSNSASRIGVNVPALNFKRQWLQKGSKVMVEREMFDELLQDNGFRYMIENGMLYIKELDVLIENGLEDEGATEPVRTKILTDNEMDRMMNRMPMFEFRTSLEELSIENARALAEYAIEHKITNFDKCEALKAKTGRDILMAVRNAAD